MQSASFSLFRLNITKYRISGQKITRWLHISMTHCLSVCAPDREREAVLEADAGGRHRERPASVQQSPAKQGGLAEPCTHLPAVSNAVGPQSNRCVSSWLQYNVTCVCMVFSSLVHSGPDRGSPHSGTELFFATRTGTRLGIETHLFRAETSKDLSVWTRHIVSGCHSSAEMIKEVTTSE